MPRLRPRANSASPLERLPGQRVCVKESGAVPGLSGSRGRSLGAGPIEFQGPSKVAWPWLALQPMGLLLSRQREQSRTPFKGTARIFLWSVCLLVQGGRHGLQYGDRFADGFRLFLSRSFRQMLIAGAWRQRIQSLWLP